VARAAHVAHDAQSSTSLSIDIVLLDRTCCVLNQLIAVGDQSCGIQQSNLGLLLEKIEKKSKLLVESESAVTVCDSGRRTS